MKKTLTNTLLWVPRLLLFGILTQFFLIHASYANQRVKNAPISLSYGFTLAEIIKTDNASETSITEPTDAPQPMILVKGKVTSSTDGIGLPGVNVLVKGTSSGTVTDAAGDFTVNAPNQDDTLVVSFIGYITQEVPITGRSDINITMAEDVTSLNEIVVVGYGTQERAEVTGAISTVTGKALTSRPLTNTATALAGRSPGLTVMNQGAAPGAEDVEIRIRGVGTLNNSNPLVLVDGIEQALGTVEPQNIESISVLKDAASSAIYGSRAANGVILVTTKRGAETGTTVSYNTFFGVQNPSYFPEGADPESWLRLENEAQVNAGGTPTYSEEYIENVVAGTNPLEFPFADWEKVLNPNAFMQQHNVSVSSGGEAGKIFASVNFTDADGIIDNFNNLQTTMRINADLYASDKLTFKTNLMYRNSNFSGPGHALNASGIAGQRIIQGLLHINRNVVIGVSRWYVRPGFRILESLGHGQ